MVFSPSEIKAWSMRFSLLELLALVGVVAVGCVALQHASSVWSSLLFSVIVLSLSASVFGAIWRTGVQKASCLGFAVTGGLYFMLAFGPGFSATVVPALPSGEVMQDFVYPTIRREVPASTIKLRDGTPLASQRGGVSYVAIPFMPDFSRVSHSLVVLVMGIVGACLARWFAHRATTA
jgi:hypothetical protein